MRPRDTQSRTLVVRGYQEWGDGRPRSRRAAGRAAARRLGSCRSAWFPPNFRHRQDTFSAIASDQRECHSMNKRFNPPPNWPAPPAGWTPPPGWLPDPVWGPPPVGWQLWVDEPVAGPHWAYDSVSRPGPVSWNTAHAPRKKRRAIWLVLLAIVVALFAGCAVIASGLGALSTESQLKSKDRTSASQAQIDAATELSERDLALLVKSPDSHSGKTMIIYARITQFDAATGQCIFRANISHKKMENSWEYGGNSMFRGGDGRVRLSIP